MLRLQAIVVTLATMFILQGVTLLVMDKPGGQIPAGFSALFTGDAVPGLVPAAVVLLVALAIGWALLKNTVFGKSLYAVGSDRDSAFAAGFNVRLLGGGRGGLIGAIFGAYVLTMAVNILLALNVPAFYSSVVEGAILILAVLGSSLARDSVLAVTLRTAALRHGGSRPGGPANCPGSSPSRRARCRCRPWRPPTRGRRSGAAGPRTCAPLSRPSPASRSCSSPPRPCSATASCPGPTTAG